MGPRQCNRLCQAEHFSIKLLQKNWNYTLWSSSRSKSGKVESKLKPHLAKRYTTKHKNLGLKRCRICEFITATQTNIIRCPCCNSILTQAIRDIKARASKYAEAENIKAVPRHTLKKSTA